MAFAMKKQPAASRKATKRDGKDTNAAKVSKKTRAEMERTFVATLPLVNVLSPEVQEVVELQRLKRLFAGLSVAAAVLVSAGWLLQGVVISAAEDKLAAENDRAAELTAQRSALTPVASFYAQIEANRGTIQTTMAQEVRTSRVLRELDAVAPAGIAFGSVSVTLDGSAPADANTDPTAATASSCPSQNPYAGGPPSAGCITVDGEASSRAVLGRWLDAVEATDVFTVAFIPTTTAGGENGGVTFSATIGLDAGTVYENRYADPQFLKAGAN